MSAITSGETLFEDEENILSQPSIRQLNNTHTLTSVPHQNRPNKFKDKCWTLLILAILILFFLYLNSSNQNAFHPRKSSDYLFNTNPTQVKSQLLVNSSQEKSNKLSRQASKLLKLKQEIERLKSQLAVQKQDTNSKKSKLDNQKMLNKLMRIEIQIKQGEEIIQKKKNQIGLKGKTQEERKQIYDSRIYSGQIHFSRIPVQYWQHRILMIKAMGMNTLSVYIMWNYHQIQPGKFDYSTQNKNISKFLELASKHNMKVLLRPGPYICGEWDFGGLPARLLGNPILTIRSQSKLYLDQVNTYFTSLVPIIKSHLPENKGCIKMIQIQNELGSINTPKDHTLELKRMWEELGIRCQFYIEDAAYAAEKQYWEGAAIGLSGGNHEYQFLTIARSNVIAKDTLVFGGQIYSGWMTHWGQNWGGHSYLKFQEEFTYLVSTNKQFSVYMAHGGTNFGLTAGANAGIHNKDYQPMITSYDYDSPITEQGGPTKKYQKLQQLMTEFIIKPAVEMPDPIPTMSMPAVNPVLVGSLLQHLGQPHLINTSQLYFFEHDRLKMYNQGIVVYETKIKQGIIKYTAIIHDLAVVFVDGEFAYSFSRIVNSKFNFSVECRKEECNLQIVVQAMGHNNYGQDQQDDLKGMLSCDYVQKNQRIFWNLYTVPIDQQIIQMNKISNKEDKFPAIFKANFDLTTVGDTYIDLKKYSKGYLWINGRNLGRFWNRGPQFRLYCPGVWLKQKDNELVILQLLSDKSYEINSYDTLTDAKPWIMPINIMNGSKPMQHSPMITSLMPPETPKNESK